MRLSCLPHAAALAAVAAAHVSVTVPVRAQSTAARSDTGRTTTVMVMPFEFGASLPAQSRVAPLHRPTAWPPLLVQPSGVGRAPFFAHRLAHAPSPALSPAGPFHAEPSNGGEGTGEAIGVGVADLLVERLLDVPGIRVVERRRLDLLLNEHRLASGDTAAPSVLRARYIITGSVTRFGTEERRALGGFGGSFGLGALGFKRPKTHVALTARVIDAVTGEVIASVTGAGASTKGGGVVIGGIGGGIGGGVALTSSEFRASALGEATDRAIRSLVAGIVARRGRLE